MFVHFSRVFIEMFELRLHEKDIYWKTLRKHKQPDQTQTGGGVITLFGEGCVSSVIVGVGLGEVSDLKGPGSKFRRAPLPLLGELSENSDPFSMLNNNRFKKSSEQTKVIFNCN